MTPSQSKMSASSDDAGPEDAEAETTSLGARRRHVVGTWEWDRWLKKGRRRPVAAAAAPTDGAMKREVEAIVVGGIGWMDWSGR
jgi:hypothetical protein